MILSHTHFKLYKKMKMIKGKESLRLIYQNPTSSIRSSCPTPPNTINIDDWFGIYEQAESQPPIRTPKRQTHLRVQNLNVSKNANKLYDFYQTNNCPPDFSKNPIPKTIRIKRVIVIYFFEFYCK